MGMVPPQVIAPAMAPAQRSWKLTHDPHHDVTQNEEKEEDTADDICTAPGREVGKFLERGCGEYGLEESRAGEWGDVGGWVRFILFL